MKTPPKDGTMILAEFKNWPTPLVTMWNGFEKQWVAAMPQVEPVHGTWNDCYFENEYINEDELIRWEALIK